MKRYLTFYWHEYYPEGGMYDLIGSFDTPEESSFAIIEAARKDWEYEGEINWGMCKGHVYDTLECTIVWESKK